MSRVSVTNPYDLLSDENEDSNNAPVAKPAKTEAKPAAKPAAKTAAKAPAKPAAATNAVKPAAGAGKQAAKPAGEKAPKPAGDKPKPAGDKPAAPKASGAPAPAREANTNLVEREKEYRPRNSDRRDKPQGQRVGQRNETKRPFDRKSGTGRAKGEVARGGEGKGNWGAVTDTADAKEEKPAVEKEEDEEKKEGETAAEGEKKEGEETQEAKEEKKPEPKEISLDEYMATLKQKAPKVDAFQVRTVNADEFATAGLVPLNRTEEDGSIKKKGGKKERKDKKEETTKVEVAFKGYEPPRSEYRGERRGPPRNDRPFKPKHQSKVGGPVAPANAGAAGNTFNKGENDFPALGGNQPVKA